MTLERYYVVLLGGSEENAGRINRVVLYAMK